jgi:hypothetical protein
MIPSGMVAVKARASFNHDHIWGAIAHDNPVNHD